MDATQAFDACLTLFILFCAMVSAGALFNIADIYLDPPPTDTETRGVEL
jgi:hypothetical protein